jgi:acyl-CoA thioester hydrolase
MTPADHRRDQYRWWMQISSRWADCDAYGHVNNAIYYNWFDTAVTTMLIERGVLRSTHANTIGLCVSSGCDFLAPIEFPETVDAGVRIGRMGNSSIRFEVALFPLGKDAPAAVGHFVHVYVDPITRRPMPLDAVHKQALADLVTG